MKINVSKRWDDTKQKYVPHKFSLEGDGDEVILSYDFVEAADPEWFRTEGRAFVVGPYVLEILHQKGDTTKSNGIPGTMGYYGAADPHGDYVCRLLTDPKRIEFALTTPWEGMGR